ncbi:MAG: DUF4856 domain-containing protein [Polaribacter sp.]|uniref:DUF4856 domain-containing protein n=1 Tax=Polaribacter sp. TaxID=1920175 RepID=UPI0032661AA1
MKKVLLSLSMALVLLSCNNSENELTVTEAPATYSFKRNGVTTVSYSGQTTRIAMGGEFVSALSDNTQTTASLSGKFAHVEGEADFTDADLNASSKSIRSKTAASTDFYSDNTADASIIKAQFDSWIAAQVNDVFPQWDEDASAGVAGGVLSADGTKTRYVNEKGLEYNQVINKGLIGGLMIDQIVNNYLSVAVLDAGDNIANNDADILDGDNNYTTMEHKWDEAFGYLYGLEANATAPTLGNDSFLNKYLDRVDSDEDFTGIATDIYNAFKLGRAAIVNKDYTTRNEQAEILREKLSIIIGVRAVHYLQAGKDVLDSDKAAAFHDLSEGLGFVYSLQFTRKPNSTEPYLSKEEVDGFMTTLQAGNGFWDVTSTTLDDISTTIASKFSFTVAETH